MSKILSPELSALVLAAIEMILLGYDEAKGRSKHYDSEQEAIDALIAAGADRIQRVDCSFAKGK